MVFTLTNTTDETIYVQKKELLRFAAFGETDTAIRNAKKYRVSHFWISNFRKIENQYRCIQPLPGGDTLNLLILYDKYIAEMNRSLKTLSKGGESYFIIRPDSSIRITSILSFDLWFKPVLKGLTKNEIDAAKLDFELNVKYYTSSSTIVKDLNILVAPYPRLKKTYFRKLQRK
jgi:hypothetical protein